MDATGERNVGRMSAEVDGSCAGRAAAQHDGPKQLATELTPAKVNRRDKSRRQRTSSAFGESSPEHRGSLRSQRADDCGDDSSSFEALFEGPRLRRHCSEKGRSSSSSARRQQRPSRPRDMESTGENGGGDATKCSRSLSCRSRGPLRPTELNFGGAAGAPTAGEPRRRTYSMPSKNKRAFLDAQKQQGQRSSSGSSTPEDFVRVRTFSTSSKGILNRGDSFKRKRRATTTAASVAASAAAAAAAAAAEAEKKRQTTALADAAEAIGAKTGREAAAAAAAAAAGAKPGAVDGLAAVRRVLPSSSAEKSRVLVMGGAGVGKRSIMQQFLTSEYMGTADSSSLEDSRSMTVSVVLDEEEASLDLVHHPSGVATLPPSTDQRADAYCIVYSVSDRESFLYAREILSEIKKKGLQRGAVQILVANKADLVRQRQVSEDEGKLMAARYRGKYIEVSAVLNHKIDDLLVGIVRQIQLKRSATDRKKKPSAEEGGCYPAREIVDLILGKQRRIFNSCDNLLVL